MRQPRLLVLGGLIAVALVWLLLVLPRSPDAPASRPATAPRASAVSSPPRRAAVEVAAPAPSEPPPDLPPTVAVAPLAVPAEEAVPRPAPKRIDADHAAYLFADLLAKQDVAPADGDSLAALWKRFSREKADAAWASVLTPHVEESMRGWIDALPESVREHVAVVHVECRATLCQILVADNDPATLEMRAALGQEWMRGNDFLLGEPWWGEAGLSGKSQQTTSSDGYALTVTYLRRAAAAPSP